MKKLFIPFFVLVLLAACSGRIPSPQATHKIVTKHFQKYGKKYKESDFGKYPLEKVEIIGVQEMQKNMAGAEAYAYLGGGPVYWVRVTLLKKPFGWKSIAWETLEKQ